MQFERARMLVDEPLVLTPGKRRDACWIHCASSNSVHRQGDFIRSSCEVLSTCRIMKRARPICNAARGASP
jgi:hypothetical protein